MLAFLLQPIDSNTRQVDCRRRVILWILETFAGIYKPKHTFQLHGHVVNLKK